MKTHIFVVTIVLLLSLVAIPSVAADSNTELPIWEVAFDPTPILGPSEADDTALEFKGRLYFKFWGDEIVDQAWSTPDGENWSLAWEATSIQEDFEYFWPMIVFENQIYVVLRDGDGLYSDRIVRTPDGQSWETVAIAEGDENLWVWYGRLMSFDSQLYIFVITGMERNTQSVFGAPRAETLIPGKMWRNSHARWQHLRLSKAQCTLAVNGVMEVPRSGAALTERTGSRSPQTALVIHRICILATSGNKAAISMLVWPMKMKEGAISGVLKMG